MVEYPTEYEHYLTGEIIQHEKPWVKVSDTEAYNYFLQELLKRGRRRVELEQLLLFEDDNADN